MSEPKVDPVRTEARYSGHPFAPTLISALSLLAIAVLAGVLLLVTTNLSVQVDIEMPDSLSIRSRETVERLDKKPTAMPSPTATLYAPFE